MEEEDSEPQLKALPASSSRYRLSVPLSSLFGLIGKEPIPKTLVFSCGIGWWGWILRERMSGQVAASSGPRRTSMQQKRGPSASVPKKSIQTENGNGAVTNNGNASKPSSPPAQS